MDFQSEFSFASPSATSSALLHPGVTFFHLLFRFTAIFYYVFGYFFTSSFVSIFIGVTMLLSLDFWTVKNVTGRIMVSPCNVN